MRDGGFSLFRAPFGAHHYRSARNSPSSVTPPARCRGQKQKAWFLLLREIIVFTKKSLRKSRAKALRNAVSLRETPLFAALPLCNGFSTLFALFRATYYRTGENSPSSVTPPARCRGQKQKAWFLLLRGDYRNRAHSPLFLRAEGFRQQGSRKSQGNARDFWEEEERSTHASFAPRGKARAQPTAPTRGRFPKSMVFGRAIDY